MELIAQGGAAGGIEGGGVRPCRPGPGAERLPQLVEVGVAHRRHQHRRRDLPQPGPGPQLGQAGRVARAGRHPLVQLAGGRVEGAGGVPERPQQHHRTGSPRRRPPPAARPRHPAHLPHRRLGIGHEREHELRQHPVEGAVGEREVLGAGDAHVGAGDTPAARLGERLRRVDGGDAVGAHHRRQLLGEEAGPAPDIEHPVAGGHPGHLDQAPAELGAVATDVAVVGLGRGAEQSGSFGAIAIRSRATPRRRRPVAERAVDGVDQRLAPIVEEDAGALPVHGVAEAHARPRGRRTRGCRPRRRDRRPAPTAPRCTPTSAPGGGCPSTS